VSVTFCGQTAEGRPVMLDLDDAAHLNLASANARAFLGFLGLETGEHLVGEATMPMARRAIILGRATFERRVGSYTRESSDTKRPGRCRVIEGGIDDDYFAHRFVDFERFLCAVAERGAMSIYWA
jgi:hypothetical protein